MHGIDESLPAEEKEVDRVGELLGSEYSIRHSPCLTATPGSDTGERDRFSERLIARIRLPELTVHDGRDRLDSLSVWDGIAVVVGIVYTGIGEGTHSISRR